MKQHVLVELDNLLAALRIHPFAAFVVLGVILLEGLLYFSRNQFNRCVRRFGQSSFLDLNLAIIIDRVTSEFVIILQAVHDGRNLR